MELSTFTYFYPEKPFLLNIAQDFFKRINAARDLWVAEKKYNGTRLQLHYIGNNNFQFWDRHGNKIRFIPNAELQNELDKLKPYLTGYCLFDGEFRHHKTKGIDNKIMLFDIFILNNELLLNKPFYERRNILEKMGLKIEGEPLGLTKQYKEDFYTLFQQVTAEEEIEGLVLKKLSGTLKLGRKSGEDSTWMYKVRKASKKYKF